MEQYILPPHALACARKHLILLFNPWISVQYSKEMITCKCFKLLGVLGSDICLIQNDERHKMQHCTFITENSLPVGVPAAEEKFSVPSAREHLLH